MNMYLAGHWTNADDVMTICSPYSGEVIDTVPAATADQVEAALESAAVGANAMASLSAYDRNRILLRAADLITQNLDDLARTISLEEGKPLSEARGEVGRIPDLLRLSAFEGTQLRGETLPIDAQSGAQGRFGMTVRVPCGVVLAIAPFNYPLLLVAHKVAPALAAGNAVILKPASQTPLTALKFTRLLLEAGLPENGIQCVTGSGARLGSMLTSDCRVRKISFTGSTEVGRQIAAVAGIKKLSLELGANCPVIVLPDGDVETAAKATAAGGFINAGQVCISPQRILVHRKVHGDFLDALTPAVESIPIGPSLDENIRLSAMITEHDARRVESWIREAEAGGAEVITGGKREGAVFTPTVVSGVTPDMRISREELFGPAVAVTSFETVDEAIALANDSRYGLGAGVFTRDLSSAMRFARAVKCGSIMINWTPLWRADLMPYGGLKESGFGKEGPRYAVEEMTDTKTIVMHNIDS